MSTSSAQTILLISDRFILYSSWIILPLGLLGNILNISMLTGLKLFRRNQCAFYIIVQSFVDCGTLLLEFISRIQYHTDQYDLTYISHFWCKLRPMILQLCMMISLTTVCFSSIDQYLATSHRYHFRQMSTLKLTQRLTLINCFCWTLHGIPFGIFYNIDSTSVCTILNEGFKLYFSFVYLPILNGILPLITSAIFSILSYSNVRRLIRRQIPIIRRKLDHQLTAMVLIRVLFLLIVSVPFGLFFIYTLNTSTKTKDSLQISIEQLILDITSTLFYFNYAGSFYLYYLSSARFRRQIYYFFVKKLGMKFYEKLRRGRLVRHNQVAPSCQISSIN